MLFELHSHSWYSQDKFGSHGLCSPVELVKRARRLGLSGIAITDHNSFKAWDSLKNIHLDDFVIVPGQEISTNQGHLIALGINEEIKAGGHFLETIDKIRSQGGISIAPHPFDLNENGLGERAQHADAVEVFNSMNLDIFSNMRARIFADYHNKSKVSGSDAHTNYMVGRGVTSVRSEGDLDSVIEAIKAGRTTPLGRCHSAHEMTHWHLSRLKSDLKRAEEHISNEKDLIKQTVLRTLMEHHGKKGFVSENLVSTLPHLTVASSALQSLLVNGPGCLM
ncbi:MAG: CehA/McbA family metallohydrolase [Nitrospirae bacterium]|nr:CehA/McbA family metallohydrolase [Nitrospirota bacterium]